MESEHDGWIRKPNWNRKCFSHSHTINSSRAQKGVEDEQMKYSKILNESWEERGILRAIGWREGLRGAGEMGEGEMSEWLEEILMPLNWEARNPRSELGLVLKWSLVEEVAITPAEVAAGVKPKTTEAAIVTDGVYLCKLGRAFGWVLRRRRG